MKMLVIYESKTGFTKKYAEWIGQELSCAVKAMKEVTEQEVKDNDLIVYGGWIMGDMINGLENIRKMLPKKLVVFGVGLTKKGERDATVKENNKLGDTPFFYMEGGTNPEKMGFFSKLIIKMVTKQPLTYTDNTDKKYAMELTGFVQSL